MHDIGMDELGQLVGLHVEGLEQVVRHLGGSKQHLHCHSHVLVRARGAASALEERLEDAAEAAGAQRRLGVDLQVILGVHKHKLRHSRRVHPTAGVQLVCFALHRRQQAVAASLHGRGGWVWGGHTARRSKQGRRQEQGPELSTPGVTQAPTPRTPAGTPDELRGGGLAADVATSGERPVPWPRAQAVSPAA